MLNYSLCTDQMKCLCLGVCFSVCIEVDRPQGCDFRVSKLTTLCLCTAISSFVYNVPLIIREKCCIFPGICISFDDVEYSVHCIIYFEAEELLVISVMVVG